MRKMDITTSAAIESLQIEKAALKAQRDQLFEFVKRFNEVCALYRRTCYRVTSFAAKTPSKSGLNRLYKRQGKH